MAYRQDDRARCESCEVVLATGEGTYAPDGRMICRTCNSSALVAQSNAELAADRVRTFRRTDRDAPRRERSPVWGWVLIAPSVVFGIGSVLGVLEYVRAGWSCAQSSCIIIALFAFGGLIFGSLPALIGVVLLPSRLRRRGVLVALGALFTCLVSLVPVY